MRIKLMVLALSLIVLAECTTIPKPEDVQQTIRTLEDQLDKAFLARDEATLEKLWAPEYFVTNSLGQTVPRDSWLAGLRAGRADFSKVTTADLLTRVYDQTAVVTGRRSRTGTFDGKDFSDDLRFIHVWIRTRDGWRLVASQSTAIK